MNYILVSRNPLTYQDRFIQVRVWPFYHKDRNNFSKELNQKKIFIVYVNDSFIFCEEMNQLNILNILNKIKKGVIK